jgi:hypothetical protein
MSWEIFTRKMVTTTDPVATMMRSGRMFLNKSATARFEEKAVERVLLYWNQDTRQVGIKPITKKDTRSYKISYSGRGNSAGWSAVMFYKFINYNWDKTRTYPIEWNDEQDMYIFTVPAEHLTGSARKSRSTLAPKAGPKDVAKLIARQPKGGTHLTQ